MVTRRTFILPGRLILLLIVVILLPLVIATRIAQPENALDQRPGAATLQEPS